MSTPSSPPHRAVIAAVMVLLGPQALRGGPKARRRGIAPRALTRLLRRSDGALRAENREEDAVGAGATGTGPDQDDVRDLGPDDLSERSRTG